MVKRTRIKICGITCPEDALAAVDAGADAIGLVFYQASPRAVTIEQARAICQQLPPFVTAVALTVDADTSYLQQILEQLPIGLLQFHGEETPQHCASFGRPYLKAIRMKPGLALEQEIERYTRFAERDSAQAASGTAGILLDAYTKGVPGGTGESFDWDLIPANYRSSIVLAGGLRPGNIQQAISQVRPYGVDVSGGVEAEPGRKSSTKIDEFIANVNLADRARSE